MKSKQIIIAAAIYSVCMCACTDEARISQCAQKYLEATANYNISKAYTYASEETITTLQILEEQLIPNCDPSYIERNTPAKIKITEVIISDDSTAHAVYHKKTPIKEYDDTLLLIQRNGKWQAHVVMALPAGADKAPNLISTNSAGTTLYESHKGMVAQKRPIN